MHESIWIQGDPACFATKKEKAWKERILMEVGSVDEDLCSLEMEFTLSESNGKIRGYDLDNLCDPVFTVLTSGLGWFNQKQVNIQSWRAVKKVDNNPGLLIKPVKDIDICIDESSIFFDEEYSGSLPNSATDYEIPMWIKSFGKIPKVYHNCGLALIFVNINRSIASLSTGLVKHFIDCLYPILGGDPGDPDDHKISELTVKRIKTEEKNKYIRVIVWSDNKKKEVSEKLVERFSHLKNELYTINELFIAYEKLYNKQATHLDVLNWTPGFFQLTLYSYINQFAVMLSRIYDHNKDANSLLKLCDYIESNLKYIGYSMNKTKEFVDASRKILSDNEYLVIKLKNLRNLTLAHNDLGYIEKNAWEEFSPTIGEYRSLVTSAHDIVCMLSILIDLPTPCLGMGVGNDIDYLITTLQKGYMDDELE